MAKKFLDNNGLGTLWSRIKAKFATKTDLDNKLDKNNPTVTGNMTLNGDVAIKFNTAGRNQPIIKVKGGNADGGDLIIGYGNRTFVGSGESADAVSNQFDPTSYDESLMLCADGSIRFYPGQDGGYTDAAGCWIDPDGTIYSKRKKVITENDLRIRNVVGRTGEGNGKFFKICKLAPEGDNDNGGFVTIQFTAGAFEENIKCNIAIATRGGLRVIGDAQGAKDRFVELQIYKLSDGTFDVVLKAYADYITYDITVFSNECIVRQNYLPPSGYYNYTADNFWNTSQAGTLVWNSFDDIPSMFSYSNGILTITTADVVAAAQAPMTIPNFEDEPTTIPLTEEDDNGNV